nr:RNA-directed DNA polymerase, eukaryota, reverse transcriptase zinc-binding domain protein [Tanacetum cinerariifolium]
MFSPQTGRDRLGVGSIFALNRALMFKWIWRFRVSCEDMWIKVTKHLTEKSINLLSLCKRKVGDGSSISFWDDDWCGDRPLKLQFPRVYALDDAKSCTVVERLRLLDWFLVFRRPPRGARGFIDDVILDVDYVATGWNRLVHAKVNVFFWRLNLNKIPTRVNVDKRGVDIGSVLCPIYGRDVETSNHLFFSCEMAVDLWVLVARWWELDIPVTSSVSEWSHGLIVLDCQAKLGTAWMLLRLR